MKTARVDLTRAELLSVLAVITPVAEALELDRGHPLHDAEHELRRGLMTLPVGE